MPRLKFRPHRGSHLPVLMEAVRRTSGPILELGCGIYSTNPLHWACWVPKRRLVTYESNPDFFEFLQRYERDFHEVHCIDDWDAIDINERWGVAFVDHAPEHRRGVEVARLHHAEFVVAHDTEPKNRRKQNYDTIMDSFRYRFDHTGAYPHTTVFSDFHDVSNFFGL